MKSGGEEERLVEHMPKLFYFLARHILLGTLVGWSFAGALVYFDVGGLGTLIFNSSQKWIAIVLLAWFFPITFGSAAVATAVLLGADFDDDEGCDAPQPLDRLQAVRINSSKPVR